jgi:hypothetical protein
MAVREDRPVPWRQVADGVVFAGDDGITALKFTRSGVLLVLNQSTERVPWGEVLRLQIRIPYTSTAIYRLLDWLNIIAPVYAQHSSWGVEITAMLRRRDAEWDLGRPGRYSWRLQLVLDDLFDLVSEQKTFEVLADPRLWDWVRTHLVGSVPVWARALLYVELFGLQRYIGGHGAYRRQIAAHLNLEKSPQRPT